MGKVAASEQQQLKDSSLVLSSLHQYGCIFTYYRFDNSCQNVEMWAELYRFSPCVFLCVCV